MKLDRNTVGAPGKYALIKVRRFQECKTPGTAGFLLLPQILDALTVLESAGILDWCDTPETEAFVIRLKDKYAAAALAVYATGAADDDLEYGREMLELASRSGTNHPNCKRPD